MTKRYTTLAKILIVLLAVGSPLLLYQAFASQRELVHYRENIIQSHGQERRRIVGDVAMKYFGEEGQLEQALLRRKLPSGPIQGLGDVPPPEQVAAWGHVRPAQQTHARESLLNLLYDDTRFLSGMPRRYAGLVELSRNEGIQLDPTDFARYYQVLSTFWRSQDVDAATYAFLLNKLPQEVQCRFEEQQRYLQLSPPADGRSLVKLEEGGESYLLAVGERELNELNRRLNALDQKTTMVAANSWGQWEQLAMTLRSEHELPALEIRRIALFYLSMGLGVELILILILVVLTRYELANRNQKDLLATTSHELRTPLAVIRQFAEMLIDREGQVPERLRTYHNYIHRECLKMQFLVENLLSAARFEHLKLEPTMAAIELRQWLSEMVETMSSLSETEVRYQSPALTVFWDKFLIGQVITNIMENTRVHANTDLEVKVAHTGSRVVLNFRDFGQAPDVKELSQIKAFKQRVSPKSGLGLGLFLMNRIISLHSGTLAFEDALPGLRVVVALPLDCRKTEYEE